MTHTVSCAEFDRWLDQGADSGAAAALRAHAATCARCGEALAAMDAIDAWLAEPPAAPEGFGDAVMARVARLEQLRPAVEWSPKPTDEMPWWTAILQQPAVVLAAALAALVMWRGDALLRLTLAGASWLATAVPAASAQALAGLMRAGASAAPRGGLGTGDLLAIGLAVGLTPVLVYASFVVSGWVAWRATRSG